MEGGGGVGPSSMAKTGSKQENDDSVVFVGVDQLPPGFRFHPTDEEIIMHYLLVKVMDKRFTAIAIAEADFNKFEPWDLPKMAKMGEKEWFFFCQRDRKYPTGMRTNRATETGYWKATGKDKEIYKGSSKSCLVGMKKTLVFYKGRAPKGQKSNWVMHEYRLQGNFSTYNFTRAAKDSWVVCKVFHKINGVRRGLDAELARLDRYMDHLVDNPTLPPLADCFYPTERPCSSFTTDEPDFKNSISSKNYDLQVQEYDQKKNFSMPPHSYTHSYQPGPRGNDPNPILFPQNAPHPAGFFPYQVFGYQYQAQIDPMSSYPTNFPFKGGDQANMRLMSQSMTRETEIMCKVENISSNSRVNHSQDTGISNEMADDITSMHHNQSKKPFDQELEGLAFSPNMSDLDSLWSY